MSARDSSPDDPVSAASPDTLTASTGSWSGAETVKILLVDDRIEDLRVLATVLTQRGYEVHTASSGSQALKLVLTHDFGVIVLDVVMPVLDGFETARLLKQRERSRMTPIIFLTANGLDMSYIFKAYAAGAVDYLEKPFVAEVVRAKVAVFAELHRKDLRIRRQAEELREVERRQRTFEVARAKQQGELRYRALAESVPGIVMRMTVNGDLEYVNRRWAETTGLLASSSLGWAWLEAIHPEDRPVLEHAWRRAAEGGHGLRAEVRVRARAVERSASGTTRRLSGQFRAPHRWHLLSIAPENDLVGDAVGFTGTLIDCDELRRRAGGDGPAVVEELDGSDDAIAANGRSL
jgi:PAS domain S-box-containing protein